MTGYAAEISAPRRRTSDIELRSATKPRILSLLPEIFWSSCTVASNCSQSADGVQAMGDLNYCRSTPSSNSGVEAQRPDTPNVLTSSGFPCSFAATCASCTVTLDPVCLCPHRKKNSPLLSHVAARGRGDKDWGAGASAALRNYKRVNTHAAATLCNEKTKPLYLVAP